MTLTTWGYSLTDDAALPDLLTAEEFGTFSGGEYADQSERIAAEISAASAAVRNYVGWHLAPSLGCRMQVTMQDRRITRVGNDLLIQLPAKLVSEVTSVTLEGQELPHSVDPGGILRCYDVEFRGYKRYSVLTVDYTAGLSDAMTAPIRELVAHRVKHALAVPSGITSEASGGVSVTYNAGWINSAQSTTMQDANKEALAPFKLQGVF